jgi:hypothetical protein
MWYHWWFSANSIIAIFSVLSFVCLFRSLLCNGGGRVPMQKHVRDEKTMFTWPWKSRTILHTTFEKFYFSLGNTTALIWLQYAFFADNFQPFVSMPLSLFIATNKRRQQNANYRFAKELSSTSIIVFLISSLLILFYFRKKAHPAVANDKIIPPSDDIRLFCFVITATATHKSRVRLFSISLLLPGSRAF